MRKLVCATAAILIPFVGFSQQLPDRPYLTLDEESVWTLPTHRVGWALELTPTQKAAVNQAFSAYGKSEQNLFAHGAASEAEMEKLDHALASRVLGALDLNERTRLHQIALQLKGVPALEAPALAREIGLAPAQSEQIKAILDGIDKRQTQFDEALADKIIALPHSPQSTYEQRKKDVVKSMDPQRKLLRERGRADEIKAMKVLSEAQRQKWYALLGKKI